MVTDVEGALWLLQKKGETGLGTRKEAPQGDSLEGLQR